MQLYSVKMKPRKGSHSVFSIRLHLVFVTHYRRQVITAPMLERLREMMWQVCRKMDCELIEFNGESDHVHALNAVGRSISSIGITMSFGCRAIALLRNLVIFPSG